MIREIINYMRHLREKSPMIFEEGLEPNKGLHIFVKLDDGGNPINFPGVKGVEWDYYDGKEISDFLRKIIPYEQMTKRIGNDMNKVFDKKKQIVSCSPYCISFKKEKLQNPKLEGESFEKITNLLPFYFQKSLVECLDKGDKAKKQIIKMFEKFLTKNLSKIEEMEIFNKMKKDEFINIYLKNASIEDFKIAHENYLKRNLFNKNDFNSDKEISEDTFGLSGFMNGLNAKKPFLSHKTATMYKGISGRIKAKDTIYLNDFDMLLRKNIFPNPLPIFIDKNEFDTTDEIIKIFRKDSKLTFSQIIKELFKNDPERTLQNYYLLFFSFKHELEDFDFVTKFRYKLDENGKYPQIKNLFGLKINKEEFKHDYPIENIFQFEVDIVRTIFNNSLVKTKDDNLTLNYFGEIKAEFVSGGESVYQMIIKYRKAFYDYIYKSKTEAINSIMWDEIMWNSIIGDLRSDKITEKGYHSKENVIKEKLNIWFSLYNYFIHSKRRTDMASKIPELLEKMKKVANNKEEHFTTVEEFAFGAGQVIFYLLTKSKASERTHALLEPFIQKVKAEQLQDSISRTINTYKHELNFGQGRFERLAAEVLAFETKENLKNYQRYLLAGYFSEPVIYEKKQ